MSTNNYWKEISNNHIVTGDDALEDLDFLDGDVKAVCYIDAWKTDDDWEEGVVIAHVVLTEHGNILVIYHDPEARTDKAALAAIMEAKQELRKLTKEVIVGDEPELTMEQLLRTFHQRTVFLKEPVKMLSPLANSSELYFFTVNCAAWDLMDVLESLALTKAMSKADANMYRNRIGAILVREFAKQCPPPTGKRYVYAGVGPLAQLLLRIEDAET